jgi:NADH-quinone oxidoreductase subunit L
VSSTLQSALLIAIVALPFSALLALAVPAWFHRRASERAISRVVAWAMSGAVIAALLLAVTLGQRGGGAIIASLGAWFRVGHYAFPITLVGDGLSIPFALFSAALVFLIGAFSRRYLHREAGFFRFYLLLTLFGTGVELVVLAGSLDLVIFGWELVGLTSALLIAFFSDRQKPVEHGLRAFVTYRACDLGLLIAAVWLHARAGTSTLTADLPGGCAFAGLPVPPGAFDATLIGLLLLFAAMGKSAQVPFGGWLPRALEGPTPSSAIFYGAISVHLGAYLLLRAAPILERAPIAAAAVVLVGTLTAFHGTFVGRAQTDIKSALAYASMTQVGLIFVEVGLGFRLLALAHIVGHAAVRSAQILRSPSLLHDHHHLERAMAEQLPRTGQHLERWVPRALQPWLYRHALERGYFDAILRDHAIHGFVRVLRHLDALDQRWAEWLSHPLDGGLDGSVLSPQQKEERS